MTRMEALIALKEAVEADSLATVSAHHIYVAFGKHLQKRFWECFQSGSLDAAQTVQNSVMPNAWLSIDQVDDAQFTVSVYDPGPSHGTASCIARAWLLAILSALIAKEQKT